MQIPSLAATVAGSAMTAFDAWPECLASASPLRTDAGRARTCVDSVGQGSGCQVRDTVSPGQSASMTRVIDLRSYVRGGGPGRVSLRNGITRRPPAPTGPLPGDRESLLTFRILPARAWNTITVPR